VETIIATINSVQYDVTTFTGGATLTTVILQQQPMAA
jgi:hypothetical protein